MKKTMLSILLAAQLVVSLAATGFAATDQVTYHIGSISPVGYLLDDDTNRVDFQDSAGGPTRVRYGETVYFPLLNNQAAAGTSEEQLLTRSSRLADELEQENAYLDSLHSDLETARRNLENALNAAVLSKDILAADLEGLIAAIDAETAGAEQREAEIASLQKDLMEQQAYLDSAIELDSAADAALEEIRAGIRLAEQELEALRNLVPPVRERNFLEERREELLSAIQDSGGLLTDAEAAMADPLETTAALTETRSSLTGQMDGLKERISEILDGLLPGSLTAENYSGVYQPYLDARQEYRGRPDAVRLDSGAEDYLDDPSPDPDGYPEVVVRYGEAIRELLAVYRGASDAGSGGIAAARNLAGDLGELGLSDDMPDQDGSLYARLAFLREELSRIDGELSLSRKRDAIQSSLRSLESELAELDETLAACSEEIEQLAGGVPTLSLDPELLTPEALGSADDGWEADSMIGRQQDRLFSLLEEQSDREREKANAAEKREDEQAAHDEISRKLSALTDPDAPSAVVRATRLRQNYPFLLLSQALREAGDIETLSSDSVLDELDGLLGLFLSRDLENRGLDSDEALLEKMRVYESYRAAESAYSRQLPRSSELARSASAAALAYRQASSESGRYPYVYENKAVDGVKLKSKWEEGKRYVDEISLVKKRYQNDSGYTGEVPSQYIYFIALKLKDRDTTSASPVDLFGTISMKKSSRSDSLNKFDYEDMELEISLEIGFTHPDDANLIPIDPAAFYPDEDFDENEEETFDFEADDDSFYVANTKNQKKLVLGMNTDYDDEIGALYEDQTDRLLFWNGNGGFFNRSGYLYLAAEEDSFLYRIGSGGGLVPVSAEYDEYEGCFVIRTRALGRYAVSDVELELIDPAGEDPEEQVVVVITPDDGEPPVTPSVPAKPSPGWSQGSRSDEEETPASSSQAPAPESSQPPELEAPSEPEELPAAAEAGDISVPLLIGVSIAGAMLLTLIVFLIIGAKYRRLRRQ